MKCDIKKIVFLFLTSSLFSSQLQAGAFQLWEQDGASVGNYHAGRAAVAEDASTAFYNPAGLVRIHNQQMVLGMDPILTNFKFRGRVNVSSVNGLPSTRSATAQGGGFNLAPHFHYAAPLSDGLVFGLSVVAPFGLKTDYGRTNYAQYSATKTSLYLIDIAPALGMQLNPHWSVGFGLDAERAQAQFNAVTGASLGSFGVMLPTLSNNKGKSWGYGYHLGVLYQFNEYSRVGLAYHSKITQRLRGTSQYSGLLATAFQVPNSRHLKTNVTLPATTTLSAFHQLNNTWDVMGTVIYTQWSELRQLVLQNVSGIASVMSTLTPTQSLIIVVPEHYHNTWNIALGANYHLNDQWIFRSGIGYDESPANDRYRNLQLPDSDRIALALGTHYQFSKTMGLDVGWTHIFAMNTRINNLSQTLGAQTTTVNGSVRSSADVFGLQLKWDIV